MFNPQARKQAEVLLSNEDLMDSDREGQEEEEEAMMKDMRQASLDDADEVDEEEEVLQMQAAGLVDTPAKDRKVAGKADSSDKAAAQQQQAVRPGRKHSARK